MRALIVFESMYGNTHAIADALASGLRPHGEVEVVHVGKITPAQVVDADFLVVGGPTHVHGMTSTTTRKGAVDTAGKSGGALVIDPDVAAIGLRDWFEVLPEVRGHGTPAVAFDTRTDGRTRLRILWRGSGVGNEALARTPLCSTRRRDRPRIRHGSALRDGSGG